jgi:predicted RecA/RadA family phage recombinase
MLKYVQEGGSVDYTPDADVEAGVCVVAGGIVGITKLAIPAGRLGALAVAPKPHFEAPKAEGEAFEFGDIVYLDMDTQEATATAGGNQRMGPCVRAADADATTVRFALE